MADMVLVFMLAGQRFALPAGTVRECLPLPRLWRRPGMPDAVAGFFALGPETLPVLDLARLLGLRDRSGGTFLEADGLYRHLIRLDAATLLVDRALDVAEAAEAPPDRLPDPWQHGCVAGRLLVQGEPTALLDPDRILREDERMRLDALTTATRRRAASWGGEGAIDGTR